MVEELAKRSRLSRASPARCVSPSIRNQAERRKADLNVRLTSIDSIKSLIQKQTNRPARVHPARTVLIHARGVVQHRQDIRYHEAKP